MNGPMAGKVWRTISSITWDHGSSESMLRMLRGNRNDSQVWIANNVISLMSQPQLLLLLLSGRHVQLQIAVCAQASCSPLTGEGRFFPLASGRVRTRAGNSVASVQQEGPVWLGFSPALLLPIDKIWIRSDGNRLGAEYSRSASGREKLRCDAGMVHR
jgi:hypothetical protein